MWNFLDHDRTGGGEPLLALVNPSDLQVYLKVKGWVKVPVRLGDLLIYERPGGGVEQVLVPVDRAGKGYARAMHNAVEAVANFDPRPEQVVVDEILKLGSDVLRVRLVSSEVDGGEVPLGVAERLIGGAAKALNSAAHSVIEPLRHHPRMAKSPAMALLNACRFGQTERGSFVMKVACPLNAVEKEAIPLEGVLEPFARQTTLLLHRALFELNAAIEENEWERLADVPEPLVSDNLCDALLSMRPPERNDFLEFGVGWASELPVQEESRKMPVRLTGDEFTQIEKLRDRLRPLRKAVDASYVAYVDQLLGVEGDDGRRAGEVVLRVVLEEGGEERAVASLDADGHAVAIEAYKKSTPVRIRGKLVTGTGRARFQNGADLRTLDLS